MADNNRIGEACWFKPADISNGHDLGKWRGGRLRAWSTDCENESMAPFPVGVIEDDKTGMCLSIYVTRICFSAIPPGEHV